ncbi:unnamed protein product [Vicia faba]|uniref:Uncharacterized protein n=1 Tax=Vicia faba TaxID=3906 RepID=A0AAV1BBZ5_VICFA|nr:unnamed protein product [Vicia faba]
MKNRKDSPCHYLSHLQPSILTFIQSLDSLSHLHPSFCRRTTIENSNMTALESSPLFLQQTIISQELLGIHLDILQLSFNENLFSSANLKPRHYFNHHLD